MDSLFFFAGGDDESSLRNGWCRILYNLEAFCGPMPGQRDKLLSEAFNSFSMVSNVDKRIVASVLLIDLIVVKAEITWDKI